MAYEDTKAFAAWSPNMATAIEAINLTASADLLRQIVPGDGGYWLIYKADSSIIQGWREVFPDATVLLPRS